MSNNKENKKTGFKVPENYMDQLTDRVMKNVVNAHESNDAGFSVPNGYMDQLTDRILTSVNEHSIAPKVIPMESPLDSGKKTIWLAPLIAVAAIGILLFSLRGLWDNTTTSFEILDDQEVMEYVVNLETSMDQDAIELLFVDNDLLDQMSLNTQIKDDELIDYLIDEVDLNQMYTE